MPGQNIQNDSLLSISGDKNFIYNISWLNSQEEILRSFAYTASLSAFTIDYLKNLYSSQYTQRDNLIERLSYVHSNLIRPIDLENELYHYEYKFGASSKNFYDKWRTDDELDTPEKNRWASLYRMKTYGQT